MALSRARSALALSTFLTLASGCSDDGASSGSGGSGASSSSTSGSGGSTSASTGTAGQGGGTGCAPNETRDCYSGPTGTQGVGVCVAGLETCAADGSGFGMCEGQVTPSIEICGNTIDDDCSGLSDDCTGDTLWSEQLGNTGTTGDSEGVSSLHFDDQGNIFIAGSFDGTLDLGPAGVLDAGGVPHGFVAKLTPAGVPIWAHEIKSSTVVDIAEMDIDPSGNVALFGSFQDDIDGGGGLVTGDPSNWDTFLIALDSSGAHRFTKTFGSSNWQVGRGVAVAPDGTIAVAGEFMSSIDFGGNLLSANGTDAFVATFDAAGNHLWSKRFGDALGQSAWDVGLLPDGDVVVTGYNNGTIDFGSQPLTTAGLTDIFVARLDAADGAKVWSHQFGNATAQDTTYLTTDDLGGVYLLTYGSGAQSSTIDFGTGPKVGYFFLTKLDANGATQWARSYDGLRGLLRAAVDPTGAVVVCGDAEGSVDLGGGSQTSQGSYDVLVAKYAGNDGSFVWGHLFGDSNQQSNLQRCGGIDTNAAGVVAIGGSFWGNVDFGDGELVSGMGHGGSDVFVTELAP